MLNFVNCIRFFIIVHSFMAPKSMSSEKENIELKGKEKNNTDKLNLSGQIVQRVITYSFLAIYKRPDK